MSKILIVDDDASTRMLCEKLFGTDGHQVISCENGEQTLERMKTDNPDIVLMDVLMPGEKKLSLLRKILSQNSKQLVVVYSVLINSEIEVEAHRMGAIDVIPKTLPGPELRKRINHILASKDRLGPDSRKDTASNQKILVVDDEVQICELLASFLEGKGFQVLTANSGDKAVEIAKKEKPKLILLDIKMPIMDGIEALKQIKAALPDVGVVMATGMSDQKVADECAKLGAFAYVLKPFDIQYLELVVLSRLFLAGSKS